VSWLHVVHEIKFQHDPSDAHIPVDLRVYVFTGREHGCHFGHPCSRAVFTGARPHYIPVSTGRVEGRAPASKDRADNDVIIIFYIAAERLR